MEPEGGYLLDGRLWSDEEKLSLTLVRHSDSVLESGTKPRGHQGSPGVTISYRCPLQLADRKNHKASFMLKAAK